jgi:hypothetical protein
VLFGGVGSNNAVLDDTWEWNGSRWTRISTPNSPSPRWDAQMVYDPVRGTFVLFGGRNRTSSLADTWEYDGKTWKEVAITGPSARNGHAMAYNPLTRQVMLFGGRREPEYLNDFWALGTSWTRVGGP